MSEVIYQKPTAFFMTYFEDPRLTITLVAGDSSLELVPRHEREVFLVRDAWYPDDPAAAIAAQRVAQKATKTPRRAVHYLSNTEAIHRIRLAHGFQSHHVNIGCFTNEASFFPGVPAPNKEFDAVMNARFTVSTMGIELKRHALTTRIRRLALLDPGFQSNSPTTKQAYCERENCKLWNSRRLPAHLVAEIVRRSHSGLILSEREGVCRASCEYLLAGIPVVSTRSAGGRDVWYDDYNAILVEPTAEAVAAAVEELVAHPRDPRRIRADFRARAAIFRGRFTDEVLAPILAEHGVATPAGEVLRRHPFRWWPEEPLVFPPIDVRPVPQSRVRAEVADAVAAGRAFARSPAQGVWRAVNRWTRLARW